MRGLFGSSQPRSVTTAAARVLEDMRNGYTSAYANPGLLEAGNIDLNTRPRHINPDGSVSTVRSISAGMDGREWVLPTIADDGREMTDEEAIQAFVNSGRHLGAFTTPQAAEAWAQRLHDEQAAMLAQRNLK